MSAIDGDNYAAPGHVMPLAFIGWPVDPAEAHLAAIRAALPTDFHPDLPTVERVRALVLDWEQLRMGLCAHTGELESLRNTVEEMRETKRKRAESQAFVVRLLGGHGEDKSLANAA